MSDTNVHLHCHPRDIYEKLCGAVPDDQKAMYAQRVVEMVPNIRYCAYNIGDSADIAELVKLRPGAPGLASRIDVSHTQHSIIHTSFCAEVEFNCYAWRISFSSIKQDVLSKTQEKAATSLSEVTWREQRLPVKNEKLRVSLIKLQQMEGELRGKRSADEGSEKMEMYEQLLMECQDAMQIVREDIATETVSSVFSPTL